MTTHRIWYVIKRPGDLFLPQEMHPSPKGAWTAWLKGRPKYAGDDLGRLVRQAMNLEGVRACTVVTQETGVLSDPGF